MKQRDIVTLVVPFFILIILWIIFSVYHNSVTSTIPETLNIQITPISPSFDEKAISDLKKRERVLPSFETPVSSLSAGGTATTGGAFSP